MTLDFSRHQNQAIDLAKKLAAVAVSTMFENGADQAQQTVKEMVSKYGSRVRKDTLTCSKFGGDVAYDHFVDYFYFDGVMMGLGYDARHWILSGETRIPWRVVIAPEADLHTIPAQVEDKIRRRNLRGDGFAWAEKGLYCPFILIPQDKLPSEDDPDYVSKLADAVFNFLDDLFSSEK